MAEVHPHTEPLRPWEGRAILHVDLDAFFAAVEQLDHPEWRGKPVIVGGDPSKRGVVSTASYEARVYGVRSAMPSARAAQLCPDAIWVRGSFDRYREMSQKVFAILASASPRVQPVSIDEAYLDVTPGRYSDEHPVHVAEAIRAGVAQLGITCSAGLAASKSVAKIASDFKKPDGLTVVWPGTEAEWLAPQPVRALSGIGPKTADRLMELGVRTLGDLAALDETTARQILGSHGSSLVGRARGIDPREVHPNDPVKSVSNERTFSVDLRTRQEIEEALDALATKLGSRLRRKGVAGRTVTLKLRFSDFTTRTIQRTLPRVTDDEHVFGPVTRELLDSVWTAGVGVRLLGIGLSGFEEEGEQLTLLAEEPAAAAARQPAEPSRKPGRELVRGIDAVRERFGDTALRSGRELMHRKPSADPDEDQSEEP